MEGDAGKLAGTSSTRLAMISRWRMPWRGKQERFDRAITSTDLLAEAMLRLATTGNSKKTLTNAELNHLARNFSAATALQADGRAA